MYAIIQTGGKQYRVQEGQALRIEKQPAEAGHSVNFDRVLMVVDGTKVYVGTPYLKAATVTAEVVEQGRAKKIGVIKFKRRKHHMKHLGHRQAYTKVKITGIQLSTSDSLPIQEKKE